jgi:hypothetical protein
MNPTDSEHMNNPTDSEHMNPTDSEHMNPTASEQFQHMKPSIPTYESYRSISSTAPTLESAEVLGSPKASHQQHSNT